MNIRLHHLRTQESFTTCPNDFLDVQNDSTFAQETSTENTIEANVDASPDVMNAPHVLLLLILLF